VVLPFLPLGDLGDTGGTYAVVGAFPKGESLEVCAQGFHGVGSMSNERDHVRVSGRPGVAIALGANQHLM